MRNTLVALLSLVASGILAASIASADTVTGTRRASTFVSDDNNRWVALGTNNFYVTNGSTVSTLFGISTTVTFWTGGDGSTLTQCPVYACTWNGNFEPGEELLTDLNFSTGGNSGRITLSFSKGIAGIGFQLEPNTAPASGSILTFATEIAAYDGSTLLGTFYFPDGMERSHGEMNTAGFYGVTDSTGADITSIQVWTYDCGSVGGACGGFAINNARLEDSVFAPTPEPASLALLGSGVGILGFLRRKLLQRTSNSAERTAWPHAQP